ncbi:MAG: prolyl oligopeptidase family serine peptidase [Hyphomonas sp.]
MRLVFAALAAMGWAGLAQAQVPHPPLEAYGELPDLRAFTVSPDGDHAAFLARKDGKDLIVLYTRATGELSGLGAVDKISARSLSFADNEHVILVASDTASQYGVRGKWEDSAAFSTNINTSKIKPLLRATEGVYPAQTGLGNVVGRNGEKPVVFMPAYAGDFGDTPPYHLFAVNLDHGGGRIHARGISKTIDWFVDEDGTILAREDFSNEEKFYRLYSDIPGERTLIYQSDRMPFSLLGVKKDRSALIVVDESNTSEGFSAVYELGMDGKLSSPVFSRDDADIEEIILDDNRFVEGVRYSGDIPSYDFYDPDIDAAVKAMMDVVPGASVTPVSWSNGWKQVLYYIFAGDTAGSYVMQDRVTDSYSVLASERGSIPAEAIGEVVAIKYTARDGLTIPAIMTWPAGSTEATRKNLPLVVMPHGGPASHDSIDFDWMAQYFANRGYLVLQPNFRGSTGFGGEFQRAGNGEWGAKMQDDVTDGVEALITSGMADRDRICIVGGSYGGYAALAGGAFTPELYKCVVALAPVSDVERMIKDLRSDLGRKHSAVAYWQRIIGNLKDDKEKLERISPANSADAFKAPVLLIHGKDDTVVPIIQSKIMEKALKKAGKDVTFIQMKGEDHWLSEGDTRIEALRAMADFVETHIPVN